MTELRECASDVVESHLFGVPRSSLTVATAQRMRRALADVMSSPASAALPLAADPISRPTLSFFSTAIPSERLKGFEGMDLAVSLLVAAVHSADHDTRLFPCPLPFTTGKRRAPDIARLVCVGVPHVYGYRVYRVVV